MERSLTSTTTTQVRLRNESWEGCFDEECIAVLEDLE